MSYEKKVMEHSYEILTKDDFAWTDEFSHNMKIQLIELLLTYFEDIEDYEKCSKLQPMLDELEMKNENHNKTITTGSGEL
jgi:hypothetical protein